jgi:tetratricopeptide (TPR) repeat protein
MLLFVLVAAVWFDFTRIQYYSSVRGFNRGVAQYRLGEFGSALENFATFDAGSDTLLRHRALYNQGNCFVRMAEQNATINRVATIQLYQKALDSYREALRLFPGDSDTLSNQKAVALAMTTLDEQQNSQRAAIKQNSVLPGKSVIHSDQIEKQKSKEQSESSGKNGRSTDSNQDSSSKRVKTMGREQAERLLSEKRGQKILPSAIRVSRGRAEQDPPEKDW